MQVLENFLVGIGFKVDEKGSKDAQGVFDNLTRSALQFGAVVAGKFALDKVIGDYNKLNQEASNFQAVTGQTPATLDKMAFAMGRFGGNAQDAMGAIRAVQNLMISPLTGNTGWMSEASRFGFDPQQVLNAKSVEEAMLNIADQFNGKNPVQQAKIGEALGLDESTIRLLQQGRGEIEKYYAQRAKFSQRTAQDLKITSDYKNEMQDLDAAYNDVTTTIGRELTPAVTELAKEFNDWYADNRDFINGNLSQALKLVAENIKPIVWALGILGGASALKTISLLLRIPGAIAAAGGAASVAKGAAAVAGTGAAAGGVSGAAVAGVGLAALAYSPTLNDGEDDEVDKIRKRRGGSMDPSVAHNVTQYLVDKGWSVEQAAGIAANLNQESNFRPDAVGDGGRAYGIAQWHGDRQAQFYKQYGKQIQGSTLQEQLDFLHHELTEGNERAAGDRLRNASSAREAGDIVSRYYERPKDKEGEASRRGQAAEDLVSSWNGPDSLYGKNTEARSVTNNTTNSTSTQSPTYNDNRQYHINGNTDEVRRVVREETFGMAKQTMSAMQSVEN